MQFGEVPKVCLSSRYEKTVTGACFGFRKAHDSKSVENPRVFLQSTQRLSIGPVSVFDHVAMPPNTIKSTPVLASKTNNFSNDGSII